LKDALQIFSPQKEKPKSLLKSFTNRYFSGVVRGISSVLLSALPLTGKASPHRRTSPRLDSSLLQVCLCLCLPRCIRLGCFGRIFIRLFLFSLRFFSVLFLHFAAEQADFLQRKKKKYGRSCIRVFVRKCVCVCVCVWERGERVRERWVSMKENGIADVCLHCWVWKKERDSENVNETAFVWAIMWDSVCVRERDREVCERGSRKNERERESRGAC
jgi:hypothetical protein